MKYHEAEEDLVGSWLLVHRTPRVSGVGRRGRAGRHTTLTTSLQTLLLFVSVRVNEASYELQTPDFNRLRGIILGKVASRAVG